MKNASPAAPSFIVTSLISSPFTRITTCRGMQNHPLSLSPTLQTLCTLTVFSRLLKSFALPKRTWKGELRSVESAWWTATMSMHPDSVARLMSNALLTELTIRPHIKTPSSCVGVPPSTSQRIIPTIFGCRFNVSRLENYYLFFFCAICWSCEIRLCHFSENFWKHLNCANNSRWCPSFKKSFKMFRQSTTKRHILCWPLYFEDFPFMLRSQAFWIHWNL